MSYDGERLPRCSIHEVPAALAEFDSGAVPPGPGTSACNRSMGEQVIHIADRR